MKNLKINQSSSIITLIILLFVTACKDNNIQPENKPSNETELITTLALQFTDSASLELKTFIFKDLDGDGGQGPSVFDTILLNANRTYTCQLIVLDESKSPADTVSNEILEEAAEHLFIFKKQLVDLNISILDKDVNNLPLGLESKWRTGNTSEGSVKVTLKHQPDIKDGQSDVGETDLEIDFPCKIE